MIIKINQFYNGNSAFGPLISLSLSHPLSLSLYLSPPSLPPPTNLSIFLYLFLSLSHPLSLSPSTYLSIYLSSFISLSLSLSLSLSHTHTHTRTNCHTHTHIHTYMESVTKYVCTISPAIFFSKKNGPVTQNTDNPHHTLTLC